MPSASRARPTHVATVPATPSPNHLDLHEIDRRVTAAYAAVYDDDLPSPLADLPEELYGRPGWRSEVADTTGSPGCPVAEPIRTAT